MPTTQEITATVIRGHRVASGLNEDPRFPGGTLAMQAPFFRERGLDLGGYHLSTLNLSIAPVRYEIVAPKITFRNVGWHRTEPEEDFSFFDCRVRGGSGDDWIEGLIYYPHPETKPEHFQPPDVLEVIASAFLEGIDYGSVIDFQADPAQIRFLVAEKT
jgi:hypothetical protein